MISYDDAIAMILDNVRSLPPITTPTEQALGRILAEPVESKLR
jgi:molybdopterin biosynthesis enzyme